MYLHFHQQLFRGRENDATHRDASLDQTIQLQHSDIKHVYEDEVSLYR